MLTHMGRNFLTFAAQATVLLALCLPALCLPAQVVAQPVEFTPLTAPPSDASTTLPPPPADNLFPGPRRLPSPLLDSEPVAPLLAPPSSEAFLPADLAGETSVVVEPIPPGAEQVASSITSDATADAEVANAGAAELIVEDPLPPMVWYRPTSWFRAPSWDTGFELGLNGSTGTSETLSFRTGGYLKRKNDVRKIDLSIYYNSNTADGEQTQSNALLDARHDWLFSDSPRTLFIMSQTFYDEFQAFDLNVNVTGGVGYELIEAEEVKLSGSIGAGASREFGGVDDEWVPEAQLGFDYEQQISRTQRFFAKLDYFPEFGDFGDYRVLAEIGLEIELERPSNASLKIGATDRFDSNPNGVAAHNTNYSVLLLWKR